MKFTKEELDTTRDVVTRLMSFDMKAMVVDAVRRIREATGVEDDIWASGSDTFSTATDHDFEFLVVRDEGFVIMGDTRYGGTDYSMIPMDFLLDPDGWIRTKVQLIAQDMARAKFLKARQEEEKQEREREARRKQYLALKAEFE